MFKIVFALFTLICTLLSFTENTAAVKGSSINIENTRVEYLVNPVGIDNLRPRLSWELSSRLRNIKQESYHIIVSSSINKLKKNIGDMWNSGKVISNSSINIIYDGLPLKSNENYFWKIKVWTNKGETEWSPASQWTMGITNKFEWKAKWIGLDRLFPGENKDSLFSRLAARYLRNEVNLDKDIKNAVIHVSGLGLYEMYLNGKKVGDQILSPTVSDYFKRVYYNSFNVTKLVNKGQNALGIILGNGRFFSMRPVPFSYVEPNKHYGFPKLLLQMEIVFNDGTTQTIVSDENWKVTPDGPIRANNEYDGEEYDAQKEMPGWNMVGYNDNTWLPVELVSAPTDKVLAQPNPNIKIMDTIKPVSISEVNPGVFIYDMNQNMVGWVQIKANGKKGTTVKLRFAERLNSDGTLYTENLRTAKCTDTYTFKGVGEEIWEPAFTYHGFRYVEVTGLNYVPELTALTGKVIYDEMETTGNVETSNNTINSILKNAFHGIRGNYRGMPTDCPQRDERQGWLGDRSVNSYGESFIFNNNLLYTKWIADIADAQNDSGAVPNVAPPYLPHYWDNMTFPASIIIIPGHMYRQFGNLEVIRDNYNGMKKYLSYMRLRYMKDYLISKDVFGDWCMPPEGPEIIWSSDPKRITPGEYLASVYYYYSLKLMNQYASLLKKNNEAEEYSLLADSVKSAINISFFNADSNYYANNTITANALALYHGIVPAELRSKVFDNIVSKTVKDYNSHISTGLVGSQWIMRTLSDNGRPDLAFKFASNKDYPSWGYMVENGATTIWELWNGNTADPKMNSGNHVMLLGDFIIWSYEYLAGIKSDSVYTAFKEIIMDPLQTDDLKFVNAVYKSIHGIIKSSWKKENGKFNWEILIPANTSATLYIPAVDEKSIMESGKRIKFSEDVKIISFEDGKAAIRVHSGSYVFTSDITN